MESITNQAAEQFRNNIEDRIPTEPEVMSRVEETKDGGEAEMTRLAWAVPPLSFELARCGFFYTGPLSCKHRLEERKIDMDAIKLEMMYYNVPLSCKQFFKEFKFQQLLAARCRTLESITKQAAEQFRNNMEDRSPAMPEVMSGVQETKDGGEAEMTWRELRSRQIKEKMELEEREVQGAAEQIKAETQELQQDTTSQSDPKVTHTAGFIQTMSEEMLKQKERLSDNKMSVKETCKEVKIVLQQITDLVEDKLQSLREDAKLKLESLIKNFCKMTASMWKLMFCTLLLYRLRVVVDSFKYAFKMASMLALWLSHDVETNPGPEFNLRDCIEKLVRQFSETLKNDLEIGGTIWSDKVAKAAYNAGFSNNFRWKNPSGKNKDSLPDLIERAKELGRVLTERNCLPRDLAPFTVDLDQQETQNRLRQHLKTENYRAAVDALMSEPDFNSSATEAIRHLTQQVQEKMSNVTRHHTARPPPVTTHSEFGQLADSQSLINTVCETNPIISNIVTHCPSKRSQRKKNKNPKTKQISNVTGSEPCTATGISCHDMLTGGTMVEGVETDSSPGRLSNSHCTLSTSTPDTTDTPHQDQDIIEAETTGNSDFVRRTHASVAEHVMMSDSNSFDETKVNNDSEVPNQEGRRNVYLVSPSPRNSSDVNGVVEMPFDILGTISLTPDTSDEFNADLSSGLYNFMQGDDVNTAVTDTDTEMNDVPLQTDTADCALPASIGNNTFSVMTGDDRNTSSSDASNPDNSPDDETQQDAADEGCEDEETDTSQHLHEAAVPTENNRLDQPNTVTDRSCYEHVMMSDGDSFDETNVNNDLEVPSQEGRRNVELVLPSARNTCDVNDGVEMPGDMPGHIGLTPDTPDDTLDADLLSFLINCMQGNDVNTAVTDTDTEMNDVPLQTHTADCVSPANIGIDPFSVMTGDARKTSSSDASNPDNSPNDETQQDAADGGSEDEETGTSQPLHEAAVPTENNRLDQPNTATDRCQDQNEGASREERTERHESQTDNEIRVITAGTDNEMRVITAGTDTEMRVITAGTDTEMRVITAGTDTEMRVITAGTSTHVSEIEPQADERKSAEENEYITKSWLQAILSHLYVSNSRYERKLQELEATLNGLVKASTYYKPDFTLNQQVHLGESDTSLGSISGGVTKEAGSRKRKRRQQHSPTTKKRQ